MSRRCVTNARDQISPIRQTLLWIMAKFFFSAALELYGNVHSQPFNVSYTDPAYEVS